MLKRSINSKNNENDWSESRESKVAVSLTATFEKDRDELSTVVQRLPLGRLYSNLPGITTLLYINILLRVIDAYFLALIQHHADAATACGTFCDDWAGSKLSAAL